MFKSFVVGVKLGLLFSSDNCDLNNVYDDKLMIFGDKIFFCKVDGDSAWTFLTECY